MRVSNVFKAFRNKYDISLRIMAKDMGISAATLCRFEAGEPVSMDVAVKMMQWLFTRGDQCAKKEIGKTVRSKAGQR